MPLDPAVFKAIADQGLAIVAVVVLTAALGWLIRDLVKQRDRAVAGWEAQADATSKLAALGQQGHEHAEERDRQMRELTDVVRRFDGRLDGRRGR